jgi:hypothetical protein
VSIPATLDRRVGDGDQAAPARGSPGSRIAKTANRLRQEWRQAMKYLMLIKHPESYRSQPIPQGLLDAMGEFVNEGFKSGILKDTAGLKGTAEGFRVRSSGGKLHMTDGPFAESKEIVGGYALVEVRGKEEALDLARQFMELHRVHWPEFEGICEVRPLEDM